MPLSIPRKVRRRIKDLGLRDNWIRKKNFDREAWFRTCDRCLALWNMDLEGAKSKPQQVVDVLKVVVASSPDFDEVMDKIDSAIIDGDDDSCDEAGAWLVLEQYTKAVEADEWGDE